MKGIFGFIKKKQSLIFCAAVASLFILMCIPLFVAAKYNYMSADDFVYGAITHQAIQNGQPWKILGLAAKQALEFYQGWQGSFSALFLFALHPGIWGEKYYQLGIYVIMACLITMQFVLVKRIVGMGQAKISRKCLIGLCSLLYIAQIFYVPYPVECFYWFNGSLYYTIFYAFQMLLLSETLVLFCFPEKLKGKQWLFFGWTIILAVIVGGGNLATGLSTALILCLLTIVLFAKRQKHRFYILAIAVVYLIAFAVNVAAPGNAVRAQDPGYHTSSPVSTVLLAVWHCMINLYSWTDYKMWLILLMAAPFLWQLGGAVIKNWKFTFRFPLIATVFQFGIYASQLAPITYMDGTFGPKRMGDMMWFSYVLFLLCAEGYWIGWFRYRYENQKILNRIKSLCVPYTGTIQLCCLALWCVLVLFTNGRDSSTYRAWASMRNGEAQAYAAEMEERLQILNNPEIQDVYLHEIQNRPELLFFTEILPNSSNADMCRWYHKNAIILIEE